MERPPDATGWIILIIFAAMVTAQLIRVFAGRYPWEPKIRYVISVVAFIDDGPPKVISQTSAKSFSSALEKARWTHEELVKRQDQRVRYAVNIAVDPK